MTGAAGASAATTEPLEEHRGASRFRVPSTIWSGPGSASRAGQAVASLRGRRPLVLTDARLLQGGVLAPVLAALRTATDHVEVFDGVTSEPTTDMVRAAIERLHATGADVLVGAGGGSAIDTAKAVAVMADHPGTIADYEGIDHLGDRTRGLVAIPTTAGTGSEVTRVAVITDPDRRVKMMLASDSLMPDIAVVDPELTHACPPSVTASAGLDALTHAIEAFLSRRATPLTDDLARAAAGNITSGLARSWRDGTDARARAMVMTGQLQAGMAFSNASVALVHGMSRPLGALFGVPHGIANAMLLPAVLRFTLPAAVDRLAALAGPLGAAGGWTPAEGDRDTPGRTERAAKAVQRVIDLVRELEVPSLAGIGLPAADFEASLSKMAADALASGSPANNPRIPSAEEIVSLYRRAWAGENGSTGRSVDDVRPAHLPGPA